MQFPNEITVRIQSNKSKTKRVWAKSKREATLIRSQASDERSVARKNLKEKKKRIIGDNR
nr:MAG TPA: hypothetical protein [Caudoviricetes sp.]